MREACRRDAQTGAVHAIGHDGRVCRARVGRAFDASVARSTAISRGATRGSAPLRQRMARAERAVRGVVADADRAMRFASKVVLARRTSLLAQRLM